jgi:diadenosine tetraphosphate (Ap4A) HIT family hydrolase
MPKKILDLSYIQIGEDGSTLFKTDFFHVTVNRDNQVVPGILKITPTYQPLNNWDNWENNHWIELLQIIRLCELTLIKAFEPNRKHNLRPTLDDKLINCYGKNIRTNEKSIIYFDIVPRYKERIQLRDLLFLEKSEVSEEELEPFKKDNLYGKPFDFSSPVKPSDKLYNSIFKKLLAIITENDFSKWLLEDSFGIKENCIACGNITQHPHKTGITEVAGFKIALDARSQEERGRAFCDTVMHIPALRYWKDEWIVDAGKIFSAYRATVNSLYKTENNREFDWMCLMNLAKEQEGPHTHIHFIPRTPSGKDYGRDFLMDISTYRSIEEAAITANTTKAAIVEEFRKELNKNLKKEEFMVIQSERDEQQLLKEKINRILDKVSHSPEDTQENRWKKAMAFGFTLNYVKYIKPKSYSLYEGKKKIIIGKLSEILFKIIYHDFRIKYSIYATEERLSDEITSFVNFLWEVRNKEYNGNFIKQLEKKIQNLFEYCFLALNYKQHKDECAILILGSFSTGMATLYSDIEYFILIKDQKDKDCYLGVSDLFNTIIHSFGESKHLLEKINMEHIFEDDYSEIKKYITENQGLRIDHAKNPMTTVRFFPFIDTPSNLVQSFLKPENTYHQNGNHSTSALLTTKYFFGKQDIYEEYKNEFVKALLKSEFFLLVKNLLKYDLKKSEGIFGETNNEGFKDNNKINVKSILSNIINMIRQLYLLHKSYVGNDDLHSDFFNILETLKKELFIEESQYKTWEGLIRNIYKLRLSLQSERKNADITITVADLKEMLRNDKIEQIFKEISEFVENEANNIITLHEAIKMSLEMPSNQPIARLSEFCSTSSSSISSYSGTSFSINKDLDTIMLQLSQKIAEQDTLQFLPLYNKTAYNDLPENFRGFLSDNTQGERHLLANPHPSTEDFWNNMLNDDRKQILECKFRYPGA